MAIKIFNRITLRHRFHGDYISDRFDRLIIHFRNYLAKYIINSVNETEVFDAGDIEYASLIGFVPGEIASRIKESTSPDDCDSIAFYRKEFKRLLEYTAISKIVYPGLGETLYVYKSLGIIFNIIVPTDNQEVDRDYTFDMAIEVLDGEPTADRASIEATWAADMNTSESEKTVEAIWPNIETYTSKEDNLSDDLRIKLNTIRNWAAYSEEPKDNKVVDPRVDSSKEEKSVLDAKAEKAIISIDLNYTQYKNTLRSLGANITKEDVERLEALAKAIRTTSYSIAKPTTPENMLENLMSKGIIKPEFKMAFTSMFDNLIKDPLMYFFAKYEGATNTKVLEHEFKLDFQFERKLFYMCFNNINNPEKFETNQLVELFKELLSTFYKIRTSYLEELLGATRDLNMYFNLMVVRDDKNSALDPRFYEYIYKKITAFKTLASDYELNAFVMDIFANNPAVYKSKEFTPRIENATTKVQEVLKEAKVEIAKMIYESLQ